MKKINKQIEYNGKMFDSLIEIDFFKHLEIETNNSKFNFGFHENQINIIPKFKNKIGKIYPEMNYEPDFVIETVKKFHYKKIKFFIELKSGNDLMFKYQKGQPPIISSMSTIYRLKHKIIAYNFMNNNKNFIIVRKSEWKNSQFSGFFWDKDYVNLKRLRTKGSNNLCEKIPRILERLTILIENMKVETLQVFDKNEPSIILKAVVFKFDKKNAKDIKNEIEEYFKDEIVMKDKKIIINNEIIYNNGLFVIVQLKNKYRIFKISNLSQFEKEFEIIK